jgi:hypothetical protein
MNGPWADSGSGNGLKIAVRREVKVLEPGDIANRPAVGNRDKLIPDHVAAGELASVGGPVAGNHPLLAEGVLERPEIRSGRAVIDLRGLAAVAAVPVSHREKRRTNRSFGPSGVTLYERIPSQRQPRPGGSLSHNSAGNAAGRMPAARK